MHFGIAFSFLVSIISVSHLHVLTYSRVGYNTMDGLSGGFVHFGAGGSGLITPGLGLTPLHSGTNTPNRVLSSSELTQLSINAAFDGAHDGMSARHDS